MQNYELMTPNEIDDLLKVYTTVQFNTEQITNCLDLFTKDFSFNKVIPIPENYQIVHGPVIEKALATYLTNFGRNNPQMIPENYHCRNTSIRRYYYTRRFQRLVSRVYCKL